MLVLSGFKECNEEYHSRKNDTNRTIEDFGDTESFGQGLILIG
jgi:hypothetical protein